MLKRSRFLVLFSILLIAIPLGLGLYFVYKNYFQAPEIRVTKEIEGFVKDKSGLPSVPDQIKRQLDSLSDLKISREDKAKALSNLSFYFSAAYSETHDPEIRNFAATVLSEYAKNNFANEFDNTLFNFPCSDPTCGQALSPEIEVVLNIVPKTGIPDYAKDGVIQNLKTAGYIPDSDLNNKQVGFETVINQLERYGDPEASRAAALLREFFTEKYKKKLNL